MAGDPIVWKLHLSSSIDDVFKAINSNEGRAKFWAESAEEKEDIIHFKFINGISYSGRILSRQPPLRFEVEYFGSHVNFILAKGESGGTDLTLTNSEVPEDEYLDVYAGWLSVLFALKGYVDFGIDLRNHDKNRTWDQGYIEN